MIDLAAFGVILILTGGLLLAFAFLAILADNILPALARHTWRGHRPAATYRRGA